jgi:stearoyl-CoA desaturase (delta-9 desaturase)
MLYPIEAWRLHHDHHHEQSVKQRGLQAQTSKTIFRLANPLFWPYDIASIVLLYYDMSRFDATQRGQARWSIYLNYLVMALFFPLMVSAFGWWGLIKVWFAPWLLFHFWKNSLRQALPAISLSYPRKQSSNNYKAIMAPVEDEALRKELLNEMTHYSFPRIFEWMCHDINFQIPHYLSTEIPCYNLRSAQAALMNSPWREKITTLKFGWGLVRYGNLLAASDDKRAISLEELYRQNSIESVRVQLDELGVKYAPAEKKLVLVRTLYEALQVAGKLPSTSASSGNDQQPEKRVRKLNWIHFPLFIFTHAAGLYGALCISPQYQTIVWSVIYYYVTGLGITAGYHRLWSHRAYDAAFPVRAMLMCAGSGAVQGSIKWWSTGHRIHHRYTDTDDDPYNSKRGFFYAHMGWMVWDDVPARQRPRVPIDDLVADPLVRIQHTFYPVFALFFAVVFPTLVAGLLWGDYWGGYFYSGIIRLLFVHHATFCVNSLAHWAGTQPFADKHTPRDSPITAVMTLGEGYHNFHHEFPKDYRNAIKWYQYDPTKWLIRTLAFFGLTYNLKVFPQNEIKKGVLQMQEKRLHSEAEEVDWGVEVENLPTYTWSEIETHREKTGERWIVVGGLVHDVSEWVDDHPGGRGLIEAFVGKDATKAFNGGIYNHSNAGRNLLTALRVGRVAEQHGEALADNRYEIRFAHGEATGATKKSQ